MSKQNAIQVANWFIERAAKDGEVLTNLKIQKLIHIANGWNLTFCGQPLFNDQIEAWPYGPVVPSVYQEFKHYGAGSLCQTDFAPSLEGKTNEVLESVWKSYGGLSAVKLVAMTHGSDSPWNQVYRGGIGRGMTIPSELIKKHYDQLAAQSNHRTNN